MNTPWSCHGDFYSRTDPNPPFGGEFRRPPYILAWILICFRCRHKGVLVLLHPFKSTYPNDFKMIMRDAHEWQFKKYNTSQSVIIGTMAQKYIPFYSNTPDDTHCFQASMQSILGYFVPTETFSMEDLERLSAKAHNKSTWPSQMVLNLEKMGFDIVMIEGFDGQDFVENGEEYLRRAFGHEVASWQIKNSNIPQEQGLYRELLTSNVWLRKESPEMKDIEELLEQGYLVQCTVNSRRLNGEPDYVGHSVLLYAADGRTVTMHDPGLPSIADRHVAYEDFLAAWADPDDNAKNLIAIKLGSKGFTRV